MVKKDNLETIKEEFRAVTLQVSKVAPAAAEKMDALFIRLEKSIKEQNDRCYQLNAKAQQANDQNNTPPTKPRRPGR